MRKFIKFLVATVAGLTSFAFFAPFGQAMWEPLVEPKPMEELLRVGYERALSVKGAAATYCFFNPDAEGTYYVDPDPMATPADNKAVEDIPVAICLQNEAAKEVFRNYFLQKKGTLLKEVMMSVDPRENVFVISFADLQNMAYPDSTKDPELALFTRNGVLGWRSYRDYDWSWENVINKSKLVAGWNSTFTGCSEPPLCCRVKVRLLMKGLTSGGLGKTIRALHGDKKVEECRWWSGWTGKDDFLPI